MVSSSNLAKRGTAWSAFSRRCAVAKYKQKSPHTVRASLNRSAKQGLRGLWEKMGRGRKRNWKEEDIRYIEVCLEEDERTYDAAQLSQKLTQERGVSLSSDRVRKILKKRMRPSRSFTAETLR